MKKKRRVLGAKLLCSNPNCDKVALVILLENGQGCYKINEYICADCHYPMVMELADGNHKQGRRAKNMDSVLSRVTKIQRK